MGETPTKTTDERRTMTEQDTNPAGSAEPAADQESTDQESTKESFEKIVKDIGGTIVASGTVQARAVPAEEIHHHPTKSLRASDYVEAKMIPECERCGMNPAQTPKRHHKEYCKGCYEELYADAKQKSQTIRGQIGMQTMMAMGARQFVMDWDRSDYEVMLWMRVNRSQKALRVKLAWNDTYTVEYLHLPSSRAKDRTAQVLKAQEGVYCDMLADVCYDLTQK